MANQTEVRRQNALRWRREKQAEAARLHEAAKALRTQRETKRAELAGLDEQLATAETAARTAQSQVSEWHPEG